MDDGNMDDDDDCEIFVMPACLPANSLPLYPQYVLCIPIWIGCSVVDVLSREYIRKPKLGYYKHFPNDYREFLLFLDFTSFFTFIVKLLPNLKKNSIHLLACMRFNPQTKKWLCVICGDYLTYLLLPCDNESNTENPF